MEFKIPLSRAPSSVRSVAVTNVPVEDAHSEEVINAAKKMVGLTNQFMQLVTQQAEVMPMKDIENWFMNISVNTQTEIMKKRKQLDEQNRAASDFAVFDDRSYQHSIRKNQSKVGARYGGPSTVETQATYIERPTGLRKLPSIASNQPNYDERSQGYNHPPGSSHMYFPVHPFCSKPASSRVPLMSTGGVESSNIANAQKFFGIVNESRRTVQKEKTQTNGCASKAASVKLNESIASRTRRALQANGQRAGKNETAQLGTARKQETALQGSRKRRPVAGSTPLLQNSKKKMKTKRTQKVTTTTVSNQQDHRDQTEVSDLSDFDIF